MQAYRIAANRADQVCLMAKSGNGSETHKQAATQHIKKIDDLHKLTAIYRGILMRAFL